MPVSKIQIGQLWKKDDTADTYLVTRVYSEALSTMVVLRKSGAENEPLIRVKVGRTRRADPARVFASARRRTDVARLKRAKVGRRPPPLIRRKTKQIEPSYRRCRRS